VPAGTVRRVQPLPVPEPALGDHAVVLRAWREEDLPAMVAACQDPLLSRYIGTPSPYGEADARRWLTRQAAARQRGESLSLAITDAESRAVLGDVYLVRVVWEHRRAEVGCWLTREARGRGSATRAVSLLARWAFAELRLSRLEAFVEPGNPASLRVVRRCGFVREGVLRSYVARRGGRGDVVILSLLPGDLAH
jgi:RimJ/RimL family protein N-acetyltransferase